MQHYMARESEVHETGALSVCLFHYWRLSWSNQTVHVYRRVKLFSISRVCLKVLRKLSALAFQFNVCSFRETSGPQGFLSRDHFHKSFSLLEPRLHRLLHCLLKVPAQSMKRGW